MKGSARCVRSRSTEATNGSTPSPHSRRTSRSRSDEKWLAWTENFDAHITPFVRTGKSVEIGPKMSAMPVATVTRDAGEYLHWSGDSKKLYWSLGPELFSRDLKDSFAFIDGAPEKLPEAPEKGIHIGFTHRYDVPSGAIAFTNARIITMRGDEVIENGTVVIDRNRSPRSAAM